MELSSVASSADSEKAAAEERSLSAPPFDNSLGQARRPPTGADSALAGGVSDPPPVLPSAPLSCAPPASFASNSVSALGDARPAAAAYPPSASQQGSCPPSSQPPPLSSLCAAEPLFFRDACAQPALGSAQCGVPPQEAGPAAEGTGAGGSSAFGNASLFSTSQTEGASFCGSAFAVPAPVSAPLPVKNVGARGGRWVGRAEAAPQTQKDCLGIIGTQTPADSPAAACLFLFDFGCFVLGVAGYSEEGGEGEAGRVKVTVEKVDGKLLRSELPKRLLWLLLIKHKRNPKQTPW